MKIAKLIVFILIINLYGCVNTQKIKLEQQSINDQNNIIKESEAYLTGLSLVFEIELKQSVDVKILKVLLLIDNYNIKHDTLHLSLKETLESKNSTTNFTVTHEFSHIDDLVYCIENSNLRLKAEYKTLNDNKIKLASYKYDIENRHKLLKKLNRINFTINKYGNPSN